MRFSDCLIFVLVHLAALLHFLAFVICFTADVAHRDLRLFAVLCDLLDDLAAAFFRELRERKSDYLAVVLRSNAHVGSKNCLSIFLRVDASQGCITGVLASEAFTSRDLIYRVATP